MLRFLSLRPVITAASVALAATTLLPIGCGSEVSCAGAACEDGLVVVEEEEECSDLPPCGDDVECGPEDTDCYPVALCGGGTLLCREILDQCAAYPECDQPDDVEVDLCPADASCYEAELCSWTILCLDQGTPHGCPAQEPSESDWCEPEMDGEYCTYYDDGDCYATYECTTAEVSYWQFAGAGCAQPG